MLSPSKEPSRKLSFSEARDDAKGVAKVDTSKLDIIIHALETKQKLDLLELGTKKAIREGLNNFSEHGSLEKVILSGHVQKINHRLKMQNRIILLTDRAIYNLSEGYRTPYSFQRRIDYENITGITFADSAEDIVIHVEHTYDLWLKTARRFKIAQVLYSLCKSVFDKELELAVTKPNAVETRVAKNPKRVLTVSASMAKAVTQNAITKHIRAKVSKKKNRFIEDGFDLDLSYITERIIAMGFPSEDVEGLYRNPYGEVYRFLEQRAMDHYTVINLCSERTYDPKMFHRRVQCFPFDDHNCPTLQQIFQFCEAAQAYMNEDPANIIAVHCKAGKGRTGLMIASLLLFLNKCDSPEAALSYFGEKRTADGRGVTIPSQKRFVHYFHTFLTEYHRMEKPFDFSGPCISITAILLHTLPHADKDGGLDPYVIISGPEGKQIYDSRVGRKRQHFSPGNTQGHVRVPMDDEVPVRGSVRITLYDEDQYNFDTKLLQFWFHTSMLQGNSLELNKWELDKACKDTKNKIFDEDFKLYMEFRESPEHLAKLESEEIAYDFSGAENLATRVQDLQAALEEERRKLKQKATAFDELMEQMEMLKEENATLQQHGPDDGGRASDSEIGREPVHELSDG